MNRFLAITLFFLGLHVTYTPCASAAESLEVAVTAIAKRFVSSRVGQEKPMRVAVTAFVQSDRRTTQFTSLLMIALTGKMVEHGDGTFRVIERAQLETALAEIELSEVPIFDRDTAQELGKFLGVDALIVGEITPLSDLVRIDARLIEVKTVETIDQANQWVPLTPTIQRQLDTAAIVVHPRLGSADGPDARNGIWVGTGQCGDATFGVAISIVVSVDGAVSAMQVYYPRPGESSDSLAAGVLALEGRIDPATGEFSLNPDGWMYQPRDHRAIGFSGVLDVRSGTISARYDHEGCGALNLRRRR